MKSIKEYDYEYCHSIQCKHLTDDETCSKGLDPDNCEERAYEEAKDDKYYWDIQQEREKREAELE